MLHTYLNNITTNEVILPLIHTTTFSTAIKIMEDGGIAVSDCPVFKERLSYFFYSKPEYRISDVGEAPDPPIDDLYVSFVFEPEAIKPYKIFPFDTGAWKHNGYQESGFPYSFAEAAKFELQESSQALGKYISLYWGSNRKYLNEEYKTEISNDVPNCVKALFDLINYRFNRKINEYKIDNRKRTPEIIIREDISFSDKKSRPFAILMHKAIAAAVNENAGAAYFINELERLEIKYMDYLYGFTTSTRCPSAPDGYIESMKQVVCEKILMNYFK